MLGEADTLNVFLAADCRVRAVRVLDDLSCSCPLICVKEELIASSCPFLPICFKLINSEFGDGLIQEP